MKKLAAALLIATCAAIRSARADTITIGYWDASQGGAVTPIASSLGGEIIYIPRW